MWVVQEFTRRNGYWLHVEQRNDNLWRCRVGRDGGDGECVQFFGKNAKQAFDSAIYYIGDNHV